MFFSEASSVEYGNRCGGRGVAMPIPNNIVRYPLSNMLYIDIRQPCITYMPNINALRSLIGSQRSDLRE